MGAGETGDGSPGIGFVCLISRLGFHDIEVRPLRVSCSTASPSKSLPRKTGANLGQRTPGFLAQNGLSVILKAVESTGLRDLLLDKLLNGEGPDRSRA